MCIVKRELRARTERAIYDIPEEVINDSKGLWADIAVFGQLILFKRFLIINRA